MLSTSLSDEGAKFESHHAPRDPGPGGTTHGRIVGENTDEMYQITVLHFAF